MNENNNINEKIKQLQQILNTLVNKINKLTSANMSHNIPSLRNITTNINEILIDDIINDCNDNDKQQQEIKQLLEKIKRNINAIDSILQKLIPITVNNAKKQLIPWIDFYIEQLNKVMITNNEI